MLVGWTESMSFLAGLFLCYDATMAKRAIRYSYDIERGDLRDA